MAKVRLEHVWKRFGKVVAVKDFNLETEEGRLVLLYSPDKAEATDRVVADLQALL